MSTIIKRKVNGYGPYAYRVTWNSEKGHEWEYLGPVGGIDPEAITADELEQLGQSAIARYRELPTAEFANLDVANATRDSLEERFGEDVLFVRDDRRTPEVQLADDAPQAAVRLATGAAGDDRRASDGPGQEPLTDHERDSIDFSDGHASVPHARTAKSVIQGEGIDDWLSVYDPQVEDAATLAEVAQANRESIRGDRLDENDEEDDQLGSVSLEGIDSRMEREAIRGAREGYQEAEEVLVAEYGYSEADVQEAIA